jgi:hypothetical protein
VLDAVPLGRRHPLGRSVEPDLLATRVGDRDRVTTAGGLLVATGLLGGAAARREQRGGRGQADDHTGGAHFSPSD